MLGAKRKTAVALLCLILIVAFFSSITIAAEAHDCNDEPDCSVCYTISVAEKVFSEAVAKTAGYGKSLLLAAFTTLLCAMAFTERNTATLVTLKQKLTD